jgi:hypothetical protein
MKTDKDRNKKGVKKSYRKPELKRVTLAPDEAVLGNCKATTGTENSNSPGNICIICGGALGS